MKQISTKKRALFACILWMVFTVRAAAHPHVFINNSIEIICSDTGVRGIRNVWEFDEIFSRSIIDDYDLDRSGTFSEKERKDVYDNAFINIKNFNFYTHVHCRGKEISHEAVTDFVPHISDGKLIYEFIVPLDLSVGPGDHLDVCVYDDSYFIAFTEPDGKVLVKNTGERNYTFSIIQNKEQSDYGPSYPSIIRVRSSR
ncbi:MAG: DUF1007 family protein [Spirochaetota bacterium]